jgi:Potential Queuosine, Q, salvage protein family
MGLLDEVRTRCAEIAARARWVRIDVDRLGAIGEAPPPQLDADRHYLEGSAEDVAAYMLTLDAINFGSGWFPTLRKRPGSSGYFTVAWSLADHWRERGPWSPAELRSLDAATVATVLGQEPGHELMTLYAQALRDLGTFLGDRTPIETVAEAGGSAERLAETLAAGMPFFDDTGFWKRAQIASNDLALAGVAEFDDLDRLTIFADNLVPHVLRVDGVLRYDERLAAHIDSGGLLPPGDEEREIRACALHACELIAESTDTPPRVLDMWLWNRGQSPRYKAIPRHRTRTVFY